MSDEFKRIGVAFTQPRGADQHKNQYGILRSPHGGLYARFEGHRKTEADGTETQVGLPLAGVMASWRQPLIEFYPNDYATVRFFEEPPP